MKKNFGEKLKFLQKLKKNYKTKKIKIQQTDW